MLEPFGIQAAYSNSSESYNCVLKRLQEWHERPIDVIAQGLCRLADYHDIEILRGRYRLGELSIEPHLAGLYNAEKDLPRFERSYPPEQIVDDIRMGYIRMKDEVMREELFTFHI